MFRSSFLSSFVEFRSSVSEKKLKMFQPIRCQGCHLIFRLNKKNQIVRGRQVSPNSVQRFKKRSRNCVSQLEAAAAILFSDPSEKHKLGKGCVNSFLLPVKFRRILLFGCRKVENVSANQRPARHLCFLIGPKNSNLVEDVEVLLPVKLCQILFSDQYM